jgi:hypothetical protein
LGDLRERENLEDLGADGRIILKFIFEKWDGGARTLLIWLTTGTGCGLFYCGNEPSGSTKYREVLAS